MKILIISNSPYEIGGVANYTRPLALKFVELGHQVFYFYSGAWFRRYDWRINPYLRISDKDFPFECAEMVNSPGWPMNFGYPELDVSSSSAEALFVDYLNRVSPDVLHVHSRMAIPVSFTEIAAARGIKVFTTIHVYGFLCQKRVLIDSNGLLCEGPVDFRKCALCTGSTDIERRKLSARIENTSKSLHQFLANVIEITGKLKKQKKRSVAFGAPEVDEGLTKRLQGRLEYMTRLMNEHVVSNICVSNDVKRMFMRFGVRDEKLIVQQIGSWIAESQKPKRRQLHSPLVIGNIGGVGYYKGTHILLEAVSRMKTLDFVVKIFGKHEDEIFKRKIMEGKEHLPIEFLGRYAPEDLPNILEEIDLMVLPSICNDTAPQTIFESFSRYIPIIASDIGGFPDFVSDRVNGRLFTPGNADDLAKILDEIVTNRDLVEQYAAGVPRLKTLTENAEELLELYARQSLCQRS